MSDEHDYSDSRFDGMPRELRAYQGVKKFERVSAVYFLVKEKKVVYVGVTMDVHKRIASHSSAGVDFDDAYYAERAEGCVDLGTFERRAIAWLNPPLNKRGKRKEAVS